MVGGQRNYGDDERFAHIATDPRFKSLKKSQKRIKADERWRKMLKDERFTLKATAVDKRGRPNYTSMKEDLRRIYELSDSDNDNEDESDESSDSDQKQEKPHKSGSRNLKDSDQALELDIARGEGLEDSSDEDSVSEEDDDPTAIDVSGVEHPWGEMDKDAPMTTDATCRLAVCNLDWDRVQAVDLLVLFNSFKPETGVIKSVTIYPSEYGLQRLKEEDQFGPSELRELPAKGNEDDDDDDDDENKDFHREKLRQYELNRLRYYYAVVECDSAETANVIYESCDGIGYENSPTRLDLRFIPDDMVFDQKPKSTASSLPEGTNYQPPTFQSTALQCSSVKLSWDETPHERVTFMARNFSKDELAEQDLAAYIASDTDSEEDPYGDGVIDDAEWRQKGSKSDDDENSAMEKFRSLVRDLHEKEANRDDENFEMEVKWELGLKEKTEKKLKEKDEKNKKLTPWDEYREKKKRKRLEKKEARLAKKNKIDEETTAEKSSNKTEGRKKKKKKQKLVKEKKAPKVDVALTDSRFSAVYENPRYNIDQSAPEYKQSDLMEAILTEKVKRRTKD